MLALVVADVGEDEAVVVLEKVVVTHVGADKQLCAGSDGVVDEESAGATAQGDACDHGVDVAAVAQPLALKGRLDAGDEVAGWRGWPRCR